MMQQVQDAHITEAAQAAIPPRAPREKNAFDFYLGLLCVVLAGYALFGKGFAYIGLPVFYVSELTVLVGLVALAWRGPWRAMARSVTVWLLAALMVWCGLRALPGLGDHGFYALRDATVAGYGLIGVFTAAALLQERRRLWMLVRAYARFVPVFLVLAAPLFVYATSWREAVPTWPWVEVAVVHLKAGDLLVLLAGVAAFYLTGLSRRWWGALAGLIALVFLFPALVNRSGMLAFACAVGVVGVLLIHMPVVWRRMGVLVLAVLMLQVVLTPLDWQFEHERAHRRVSAPVSFGTAASRFASIFGVVATDSPAVTDPPVTQMSDEVFKSAVAVGTVRWRMDWWTKILSYTSTPDLWYRGKGFGVNLADSDGFQVEADGSLRSPHSVHMTFLARAGYPGLLLWCAVQGAWLLAVGRGYLAGRRRGQRWWQRFFVFILALWTAMMINASFDVYLEGPMGALWFWTVFGVGLAAARIYVDRHAATPQRVGQG